MNIDQDRFFKQMFPLDNEHGAVRFTPKRAKAIVESALDVWQQETRQFDRTKASRRSRSKMFFLAAAIVALTGAAAGLYQAWTVAKEARPQIDTPPMRVPERATATATTQKQVEPEPVSVVADPLATPTRQVRETQKRAQDLLQTANRLRQQGRWRDAERTYRRVGTIYPKSASVYVALIAAASIRLEQLGDAKGALDLYSRAVKIDPNGALDIEARMGIARAFQRLEQREREIASLRGALQKYDSGPMVRQAKKRLQVISRGE